MNQRLTDFLSVERVLVRPDGGDKWELIDSLIATTAAAEGLHLPGARMAVLDRERQVSTGLEQGIALPHGMLPGDFRTVGALAVVPDGVEFETLDGAPAHFVVLMLFPDTDHGRSLHVSLLAQTLRVFTDAVVRDSLIAARDPAEVLTRLADHELSLGM